MFGYRIGEWVMEWLYGTLVAYLVVHLGTAAYVAVFGYDGVRAIPIGVVFVSVVLSALFSLSIHVGNAALLYLGWRKPATVAISVVSYDDLLYRENDDAD